MNLNDFNKKYTTIFLADSDKPTKLVLLKRGSHMEFAPGTHTGLGGKIGDKEEFQNETPVESAYRELKEEAGFDNIPLHEFGRAIVNSERLLYYFFGVLKEESLPACPEGTLEWVPLNLVLTKNIISTTKFFLEEWLKNSCNFEPKTLFLERDSADDPNSRTISLQFKDGLHFEP